MEARCAVAAANRAARYLIGTAALASLPAHAVVLLADADLSKLSLEELMKVEVTTVAGTAQPRLGSPAALYVITADDIRRGGHRTLAEALRLVPGMHVGRINASSWITGTRGLAGSAITANRYLVLVDGRVMQDPLINQTLWDIVDVVIEDIDRIEVIRGPGATLWGANAMNGVINVITKHSRDTQGSLVSAEVGDYEKRLVMQHGNRTAGGTPFRVWAKLADYHGFDRADGSAAHDEWSSARGGFRVDGLMEDGPDWTLRGDAWRHPSAHAQSRQPVPGQHLQFATTLDNDTVEGMHLRYRAGHGAGSAHGWSLQAAYARSDRETSRVGWNRDTAELDYRNWLRAGAHELIWGAQYTWIDERVTPGASFVFDPWSRQWNTVNVFVQDSIELAPGLWAMAGSKLGYHDFVGFHWQPGARLWWTDELQTVWAAVSRPVRVPSRLEENGLLVFAYVDTGLASGGPASGTIVPVGLSGDPNLGVEKLTAWELGHRIRLGEHWLLDSSAFYNDYTQLIAVPETITGRFTNMGEAESFGLEVSTTLRASERLRLEASYAFQRTQVHGPVLNFDETSTPETLAQLRASWEAARRLELDGAVYWVDDVDFTGIGAYTRVDLGATWWPREHIEISLWGRNLTDPGHPEASAVEVPRSVSAQVKVTF